MTSDDILRDAAATQARAHVISIHHEARHTGTLVEAGEAWIVVKLADADELQTLETVNVAFSMGPRAYTFLASVLDREGDRVFFTRPHEILHTERRMVERTPVRDGVVVELPSLRPQSPVTLVDIAVTGMRVRVDGPVALEVGESLRAVLRFEEHDVNLLAEVRHIGAEGVGLYFPESIRRGRVSPKPELVALVAGLSKAA